MKKITALLLTAFLLISAIQPVGAAYATPGQALESTAEQTEELTFEFVSDEPYDTAYYSPDYVDNTSSVAYAGQNTSSSPITVSVSSSNTNVLKITSGQKTTLAAGAYYWELVKFECFKAGYADIIVSTGTTSYKQRVYVVPARALLLSLKQTDFNHITLKWKKIPGSSGYYVQRAGSNGKFETILTTGADTTSASFPVKWNVEYYYRIVGYVKDDVRTITGEDWTPAPEPFTARKMAGSTITSVKKSGSSSLQVNWNAFEGAKGYMLYRSTRENGTYKCIYTAKSGNITSYKQKVSKGIPYYYKLVTIDAIGKSDYSPSVSEMIPAKSKVKKVTCSKIEQKASFGYGQYHQYIDWSHPDQTYYYQSVGKLHAVCVQNNGSLKIYTLSSSFKVQKTKTIKLKYDVWGGFYQGTDGNFYVAVGYQNPKESTKKTVIKVIQYNNKWKKLKTANIKGGVYNTFQGIYTPFDAGNCRMDMQGNTLYLMTSRLMFEFFDGRHQSNISFKINTKTMKAAEANESYVSHSFNQFVKFKDGTLYILDHGDAFPRGIQLTTVSDYGSDQQKVSSKLLLNFKGESGNNFTGCKVGGMEIGSKNVLVCGTSQPHKYKIKKISGFGSEMKYNIMHSLPLPTANPER